MEIKRMKGSKITGKKGELNIVKFDASSMLALLR